MTPEQTNTLRVSLETELDTIISELQSVATHNPETDDWVATPNQSNNTADDNLAGDRVEDWNEKRALMAQLEVRYKNIKRALNKMNDHTYGICEISGQPIELERLQANPAARTNIANVDREGELNI